MDKLNNPKRQSIFQQFLYNKELRFNEIEKLTKIRSNELAYFIQKLVDDGILLKSGDLYKLSDLAEKYIPFFLETEEALSPLPVVLTACVTDGKVLLWKRNKRPYENHWSLPGGRLRLKETIEQASLRVLKNITFVDGCFLSVNAVINEKHVEQEQVKHAFLLVFTRATPVNSIKEKDDIKWFDISDLPENMIPSDRWLVQNKLDSTVDVKEESITNTGGELGLKMDNL
jgi:ADP-ribose pyrophosphatase YjhB (NUDIX family)